MNDHQAPLPDPADETLVRMRAALDEAAAVQPTAPMPVERPAMDRRRWMAIAAAAVLVVGGVAAVAVNLSGDDADGTTSSSEPAVGPDTLLTGVATIIDDGDGPQLANTVLASLPPQGGEIPLAAFEWSSVANPQTMNGTTWSEPVQVTGRWDGTAFTIDRPTTAPEPVAEPPLDLTPTPNCSKATAQAAADAVGALDWQALHLSTWNPSSTGGRCGAEVTAWFDTQDVRDALDALRADGHEVTVTYLFRPIPGDTPPPSTTPSTGSTVDTVPSGGGDWYEVTAPGLTAQAPDFTGCCLPFPAPGPDVVMVWATSDSTGLFMLQAVGHADGSPPELKFASYGLTPERAKELESKVVPGSGMPYVLDDPAMELIGQGLDGVGNTASQRYTPSTGDGDVLLTVGDYTGQLGALAGPWQVDDVTVTGRAGVRYVTNEFTVYVWPTPQHQWAELKVAASLATRADEIAASLVPATPLHNPAIIETSVPSTAPTTTAVSTVDTVPANWMFMLEAPAVGTAFEVQLGTNPTLGWHFPDVTNTPLTATAENPITIAGDANASSKVTVPRWPLGTRLSWHDRVGGNAEFVVTGIVTNSGSKIEGTTEGHVLVIDVKGPGDEQWTALATRAPEVAGRFWLTKAIRMPNEDVWSFGSWSSSPADAPMYILAMNDDHVLAPGGLALIDSEHTDVGEAMNFAQVGSTATWQPVGGAPQDLVVVTKAMSSTGDPVAEPPAAPDDAVLLVQGRLPDGGYVQLMFALAG